MTLDRSLHLLGQSFHCKEQNTEKGIEEGGDGSRVKTR